MKIPSLLIAYLLIAAGLFAQMDTKVISGVVAYEQGEYEKAVEYLDEALSEPDKLKEKNIPKAYYYRAEARMKAMLQAATTGNAEKYGRAPIKAYEDLKNAALSDDGSWKSKIRESQENLFLPLLQGGLTYINAAAQYKDNADALYQSGLDYLDPAVDLNPNNYLVYDLRGQAHLGKADTAAAYKDFKKTVSTFVAKPSPEPDMLIAYVHYRIAIIDRYYYNNPDNALKAIEAGKSQADSEWQRVLGRKEVYNQVQLDRYAEQYQSAKSDLNAFELDIYLNYPEKKQEALKKFEQAIEEDPNNYIKHVAYAQLLEEENPEKAKQYYRKAIEIDPDYSLAYFNLGAMYNNEAGVWYEKANKTEDIRKANGYQEKGQEALRAALPLFEKAHLLEPDNVTTLSALCQICINLDETEKYKMYKAKLQAIR